jgi:hypothetical protein
VKSNAQFENDWELILVLGELHLPRFEQRRVFQPYNLQMSLNWMKPCHTSLLQFYCCSDSRFGQTLKNFFCRSIYNFSPRPSHFHLSPIFVTKNLTSLNDEN